MYVVTGGARVGRITWEAGRVSTQASVAIRKPQTGARLRDSYLESISVLTLGIIGVRGSSLVIGPVELLRFGRPTVTRNSVDWPILRGLLAGAPGGHWRIHSTAGHVEAILTGYLPRLPRPIYMVSHLHVHQLFTRLYLLRLRGREPAPGTVADQPDRVHAATIDAAFCLMLAGLTGRRRWRITLLIAAAYHAVCWSTSGKTLGGLVMRQRVVAVDGSRLTPTQSMLRFALLPLSWFARRPVQDEIAQTTVIVN